MKTMTTTTKGGEKVLEDETLERLLTIIGSQEGCGPLLEKASHLLKILSRNCESIPETETLKSRS